MKYKHGGGGVMLVIVLCCAVAQAQPDGVQGADTPLEFILRPVKTGFANSPRETDRDIEIVFKQEPPYKGGTVYRRALWIGDGPGDFIGMAYDVTGNTLYLDLNQNLDLTDDGPGFTGDGDDGIGYGSFSDVAIELTYEDVAVPYVLEITIFGEFYTSATVMSGWKGPIELAGKTCTVAVSDNLDGIFDGSDVFLFDHERHREARQSDEEPTEAPLPKWLHFEGQSYHIASAFRVVDNETALAVTFTPVTEGLMDITFEGQSVSRVLLQNNNREYGLLDWPTASVMRIPGGTYTPYQVDILGRFTGYPRGAAKLEAGGNTLLKAGGPLNPQVAVSRAGAYLTLEYELRGVDGTEYSANHRSDNPRFAVYQGDRRIGEGRFEYG